MRIEHWIYTVPLRLRSLFQRRAVEQELDEELQDHLDRKTQEYLVQGLTTQEARDAARRAMQGLTQHKEECRDARGLNLIDNTMRDIRYAVRVLRKSPGFAAVAVLTLIFAIGANAVVFGVFNGLILRPLRVPRVASLYATVYGEDPAWQSYPNYRDLRERNHSFESLAAFNFAFAAFDAGREPVAAAGFATTGNYFDVLGIQPYLGRFFHDSDEHGLDSAPYVVLSYNFWHSRFLEDRGIVGRVVRVNKHPFTVVGVAPPEFYGTLLFGSSDFFIPIVNQDALHGSSELSARGSTQALFEVFGHLKAGVTPGQAAADFDAIGSDLAKKYPKEFDQKKSSLAHPGLTAFRGPVRAFVAALTLLAGLILLAACANLGGLFAAHASDRSREVALRLALGSSRGRILRELLTEAVLISLVGGFAGVLCSIVVLNRVSTWQPFGGARIRIPVTPDPAVYVFAFALAVISGILFGIVPIRQVLRTDPYQVIKSGSAARVGRRPAVRDVLLLLQIAICAVLVTSSMVAVRGLMRSIGSNFGFEPRNALLFELNLAAAGYKGPAVPAVQRRMIDAMATIPGVTHVGLVNSYPPLVNAAGRTASVFKDDARDLSPSKIAANPYRFDISPGYFGAAGTRFLAGRDLTWHDDKNAPLVGVINRTFAVKVFGSVQNAVGKYYRIKDGTHVQVVGVVEDGKYLSLTEDQEPAMFLPCLVAPSSDAVLLVRSSHEPPTAAIRAKLRALDPGLPVDIQTWTSMLNLVRFPSRVATVSLGVLGIMGAMLSITGIFGMAAYSVSRRLKELGIRMALGAKRREILTTALGRALRLLAFGSGAGLLLGVAAGRVLSAIVYQATPRDPVVVAGVLLAMLLLGLIATWMPAQRALSLDPAKLLREE